MGTTGIKGVISAANSLVGTTTRDYVGGGGFMFRSKPLALKNGNYVLVSPVWNNTILGATQAGALTWGNGSTGTVGPVSAANSLVGSHNLDWLGVYILSAEYSMALEDGNYLIPSAAWDEPTNPALTIGDGATGNSGYLNATNSVFGSAAPTVSNYDPVRQRYYAKGNTGNIKSPSLDKGLRSLAITNDAAPGERETSPSARLAQPPSMKRVVCWPPTL